MTTRSEKIKLSSFIDVVLRSQNPAVIEQYTALRETATKVLDSKHPRLGHQKRRKRLNRVMWRYQTNEEINEIREGLFTLGWMIHADEILNLFNRRCPSPPEY